MDVVGYVRVIVDSDAGIGVRWVTASSVSVAVWLIKAVTRTPSIFPHSVKVAAFRPQGLFSLDGVGWDQECEGRGSGAIGNKAEGVG